MAPSPSVSLLTLTFKNTFSLDSENWKYSLKFSEVFSSVFANYESVL